LNLIKPLFSSHVCVQNNHVHNLVKVNHGHGGTGNESQRRGHAGSAADGDLRDTGLARSTTGLAGSSNGGGGVLGRSDGSVGRDDGLGSGLNRLGSKSGGLLSGGSSGGLNSGLGGRLGGGGSVVRELLAVVDLASRVGDLEVVGVRGELRRSEGERVTLSGACGALVCDPRAVKISLRHTGQGLVVLEVSGLSVLEDDGAARVTAGVSDGVGLALSEVELGVEESRLSQGHGGEGSDGSESGLHFEGWWVVCD
jgi:hypothetical protein